MPTSSCYLFGSPAAIACERAVAELRSGRPIIISQGSQRRAILTVDSTSAASFVAFAQASNQQHYLFVTTHRAQILGITTDKGLRIGLANRAFDDLPALAWLRDVTPLASSEAVCADELDAEAVELARLGLLLPALVLAELSDDNSAFNLCLQVPLADIKQGLTQAGQEYELLIRTPVPLRQVGVAEFAVFRGGVAQRDQVAIIVGKPTMQGTVPVRVHSSCLTGDLFGSLKCDCGDQLRRALHMLNELGGGILLYLDQEGRGTGIAAKMRAYGYQHEGLDTIDADAQLGFGSDERRYGSAVAMLRGLGVSRVCLLTNNPNKAKHLRDAGIEVPHCLPVTGVITAENEQYLRTKATRAGHLLDVDALIKMNTCPVSSHPI